MELKWTKGEKGALRPGMYIVRAFGKQYAIEAGPEGVKESCWNPTPGHFICGPLDIAEPELEAELPEGWKTLSDGLWFGDVWKVTAVGPAGALQASIRVNHPDRSRCVRAVMAAVEALEERSG